MLAPAPGAATSVRTTPGQACIASATRWISSARHNTLTWGPASIVKKAVVVVDGDLVDLDELGATDASLDDEAGEVV